MEWRGRSGSDSPAAGPELSAQCPPRAHLQLRSLPWAPIWAIAPLPSHLVGPPKQRGECCQGAFSVPALSLTFLAGWATPPPPPRAPPQTPGQAYSPRGLCSSTFLRQVAPLNVPMASSSLSLSYGCPCRPPSPRLACHSNTSFQASHPPVSHIPCSFLFHSCLRCLRDAKARALGRLSPQGPCQPSVMTYWACGGPSLPLFL